MHYSTQIQKQQIADAYRNLRFATSIVLFNTIVLAVMLDSYVDNTLLFIWTGASVGVTLARMVLAYFYLHRAKRFNDLLWLRLFYIGVGATGVVWAAAPFMIMAPDSLLHQSMLMLSLAGMSVGGISSLSPFLRVHQIFLSLMLLPLIVWLAMQQSNIYLSISAMTLILYLFLWSIALRLHHSYISNIMSRLRYEEQSDALILSEARFYNIFKEAPIGVFMFSPDLKLEEFNERLCDILGAPREFLTNLDMRFLPDDRIIPSLLAPFEGRNGVYEGAYVTKYIARQLWVSIRTAPIRNSKDEIVGGVGTLLDITERMHDQMIIEHQAHFDSLTDTANRMTLNERIEEELVRFKRDGTLFAVLFLDLDHFKDINDSLGHSVGDIMLQETAKRLLEQLGDSNVIARIGGDEFVILLPHLSSDYEVASAHAMEIAYNIQQLIAQSYKINTYELNISASIGIVVMNDTEMSIDDLLKHADTAMYQAKRDGRSQSRFYQSQMDHWIKRRLEIGSALRQAIEKNELQLYYQPVIDMATDTIIGAEALLRWNSEHLGSVMPAEFIPVAEESGSILQIGLWVLQEATRQFVLWKRQDSVMNRLQEISVNVSTRQFNHSDFMMQVRQVIEDSEIDPASLVLELTESIIVDDASNVGQKMQQLRDLGIELSIDDFGTGYSSLSYLKKLPFSKLKIDRSFVQDIQLDHDDTELVSVILMIAERFNLEVIAEGVEESRQYDFLKKKKCNYFQGYYATKPLESQMFETYVLARGLK